MTLAAAAQHHPRVELVVSRFDPSQDEPARTPTTWPVRRDGWWWRHRRNRAYVLFGLGSLVVMAEAAVLLAGLVGARRRPWELAALPGPPRRARSPLAAPPRLPRADCLRRPIRAALVAPILYAVAAAGSVMAGAAVARL